MHRQPNIPAEQREIEAESIAYVLCDHFGIDTSDYSFPYIASYANQDYKTLKETLVNIQSNAHEYISQIEPVFNRIIQQISVSNKYLTPIELETLSSSFLLDIETKMRAHIEEVRIDLNEVDQEHFKDFINEFVQEEYKTNDSYIPQMYLFQNDSNYKSNINETLYQHIVLDNQTVRPFLESSIERLSYLKLETIANPILKDNDIYYMKYAAPSLMDLNIEKIGDNRIAMAHNFIQNGDVMADPDVELLVDTVNRLLIPQTYQLDSMAIYQSNETDPSLGKSLTPFINLWLTNISKEHYHLAEVHSSEYSYNEKDDLTKLQKFCKENNLQHISPKRKELER